MALMLEKTYAALIAAGAPEDKAHAAASELAEYEARTSAIESKVDRLTLLVATNLGLSLLLGLLLLGKVFLDGR